MATSVDLSKLISYAVVEAAGPAASKIVSYAVLETQSAFSANFIPPRRLKVGRGTLQRSVSVGGFLDPSQTLLPNLYTDDDTFYSSIVDLQELPAVQPVIRQPRKFTPRRELRHFSTGTPSPLLVPQELEPALYTDDDTFYSPLVVGPGNINPDLYVDDDTFYAPTVSLQELPAHQPIIKQPRKFVPRRRLRHFSESTPFSLFGARDLDPSLHINSNTFYSPSTASVQELLPSLYTNSSIFYAPSIYSNVANFTLNTTIGELVPYARLVQTPLGTASLDPFHDPVWVAVEFQLLDQEGNHVTLRISNRGVVRRTVEGVMYNYDPRLSNAPVEIGTTITVTSYGSPVRGQPNGGVIRFAIDESIWNWFTDYRWIGQVFRIYSGTSTNPVEADVDEVMVFNAIGHIAGLKHDTLEAIVQTTDETSIWDDPLISVFYDNTFPEAIRGKPKPYLWGYAFGIEPILEVEATQIYAVSYRPGGLDFINEVRVGGIPWRLNVAGPPEQGEWTPDLPNGKFTLGSPPLGMDVRCDAQQGRFTVAGLIESMLELTVNTELVELVDRDYMGRLDVAMPGAVGYSSGITPINRLDAIDDVVTSAGCWWAVGQPLNRAIAGVIDVPDQIATFLLDEVNIQSIELNTIQPPAWRIRVGFQRNWSPQTSFATSILQAEQKKWSEEVQVNTPEYVNDPIKILETRAVDVPLLRGAFVNQSDAIAVQQRLVQAWGTTRSLFDVKAFINLEDIKLYDTVAVDYMMITGNFRVTGAIRAIGHGPSTLQLWGTIGDFAVQPPLPVITPPVGGGGFTGMGVWQRNSGSGIFEIGVDTPSTVTSINIRGVGGGGGGAGAVQSGGTFYAGGGGGSGGYFQDTLIVTAGTQFNWSVGSGGSGMAYGSFGTAGDGGNTTFGSATGNGGRGGQVLAISQAGGAGGQASGATVLISGAAGGNGYSTSDPPGDCCDQFTANGAASYFGGGKHAATTLETFQGAPGSGGGGHVGINPAASSPGENGTVIVEWFIGVS